MESKSLCFKSVYVCVGIEVGADEGKTALGLLNPKGRINIQVLIPKIVFFLINVFILFYFVYFYCCFKID